MSRGRHIARGENSNLYDSILVELGKFFDFNAGAMWASIYNDFLNNNNV